MSADAEPTVEPTAARRIATTAQGPPPGSRAYRSQAEHYDRRTDAFRRWRELLVTRLPVRRGDTVLDVGCGTGLCLPLLQHKIGPTGTIAGIDESEQMLHVAAGRVAGHGWDNVRSTFCSAPGTRVDRASRTRRRSKRNRLRSQRRLPPHQPCVGNLVVRQRTADPAPTAAAAVLAASVGSRALG